MKRRPTSNVRGNGKSHGRTGASGEQCAAKLKNGQKRQADDARRNGKWYGREGKVELVARDGTRSRDGTGVDGKPQARRREDQC